MCVAKAERRQEGSWQIVHVIHLMHGFGDIASCYWPYPTPSCRSIPLGEAGSSRRDPPSKMGA